jgi:hypothetical protein
VASSYGLVLILNLGHVQNGLELRIRRFESYLRNRLGRFFESHAVPLPDGVHRAMALNDVDQDHDDGRSKALDVVNTPSNFWVTLLFLERA